MPLPGGMIIIAITVVTIVAIVTVSAIISNSTMFSLSHRTKGVSHSMGSISGDCSI